MSTNQPQKQRKIRSYILWLLFFVAFIASCPLSIRFHDNETIREVPVANQKPLEYFSVLVTTPDNAEILYLRDIPEFAKTNPKYSFLVPQEKELFYKERLKSSFKGDAVPKFEIERVSSERQKIKVGMYGDGKTVSWYEATDKEVFPKLQQHQGPMDAVAPAFYSFVASVVIVIIVFVSWKIYDWRKRVSG